MQLPPKFRDINPPLHPHRLCGSGIRMGHDQNSLCLVTTTGASAWETRRPGCHQQPEAGIPRRRTHHTPGGRCWPSAGTSAGAMGQDGPRGFLTLLLLAGLPKGACRESQAEAGPPSAVPGVTSARVTSLPSLQRRAKSPRILVGDVTLGGGRRRAYLFFFTT